MEWEKYKLENVFNLTGIYSSFYAEFSKDFIGIGERHDFWEIVYCDKGRLWITADTFDYMLKEGELVFHKPNEYHQIKGDLSTFFNIAILSFDCDSPCMSFFENKIMRLGDKEIAYLSRAVEEGNKLINQRKYPDLLPGFAASQMVKNSFESFLIDIYRGASSENKFSRSFLSGNKTLAAEIALFIRNNADKNITIDLLIKNFNISKTFITGMFKHETGMTIKEYVTERKMEKARYYILSGKYNFSQIADMLGFSSIQHFSKFFKNHSGMNLSEYKKSMKKHMIMSI